MEAVKELTAPARALAPRLVAEAIGAGVLAAAILGAEAVAAALPIMPGAALSRMVVASALGGIAVVGALRGLGPISGAQLNPALTIGAIWMEGLAWREGLAYVGAQLCGAMGIGILAHGAGLQTGTIIPLDLASTQGGVIRELVGAFGLACVGWSCAGAQRRRLLLAHGSYVIALPWFIWSTSLANPDLTIAGRIAEGDPGSLRALGGAVAAQVLGALLGTALLRWLIDDLRKRAPHFVARPARSPECSNGKGVSE